MDPTIGPTISSGGPATARIDAKEPAERADVSSSHATKKVDSGVAKEPATPADSRMSPKSSGCFGSLSASHWKATAQAHALPLPGVWSGGASAEVAKRIPTALEALRQCAPAVASLHRAASLASTVATGMGADSETGDLVGAAGNAYDVLADLEKRLAGLDPKSDAFSRELIVLQQKIGSVTRLLETITNILDMKDQVSRNIIRNIS